MFPAGGPLTLPQSMWSGAATSGLSLPGGVSVAAEGVASLGSPPASARVARQARTGLASPGHRGVRRSLPAHAHATGRGAMRSPTHRAAARAPQLGLPALDEAPDGLERLCGPRLEAVQQGVAADEEGDVGASPFVAEGMPGHHDGSGPAAPATAGLEAAAANDIARNLSFAVAGGDAPPCVHGLPGARGLTRAAQRSAHPSARSRAAHVPTCPRAHVPTCPRAHVRSRAARALSHPASHCAGMSMWSGGQLSTLSVTSGALTLQQGQPHFGSHSGSMPSDPSGRSGPSTTASRGMLVRSGLGADGLQAAAPRSQAC
jgi:hypothetical protein